MIERRAYLRSSLLTAGGAVLAGAGTAAATTPLPEGIIYTEANQGKWSGKAGRHAPRIAAAGKQVSITTAYPMTDRHFIVRHTLVAEDGTVVCAKTIFPTGAEAASQFEVPGPGACYATGFCNLHDFWVTEFRA